LPEDVALLVCAVMVINCACRPLPANKIGVPLLNFCWAAHNIDSAFYFSVMHFLDTISAVLAMT
jgi:hypothetical protein